jgi:hypothetical protein
MEASQLVNHEIKITADDFALSPGCAGYLCWQRLSRSETYTCFQPIKVVQLSVGL